MTIRTNRSHKDFADQLNAIYRESGLWSFAADFGASDMLLASDERELLQQIPEEDLWKANREVDYTYGFIIYHLATA